jgi:hypothetical protein
VTRAWFARRVAGNVGGMNRKLLLPVTLPLRLAALQMRLARSAVEMALDVTREVADRAPWADGAGEDDRPTAPAAPVPDPAAPPRPGEDPVEPARAARRRASGQRTRGRPATAANGGDPAPAAAPRARRTSARTTTRATKPAATPPTPPADTEPPPKPRARRTARKATADKPARQRKTGPTRGQAAAIREAQRETEGQAAAASAGPARGAGPQVHVDVPWEGYDAMPLDQVLARLADADETLLAIVRMYESTHENRQAVLLATEAS